jgi:Na+-transporting methylmalonyl-CoA/oxaloacetate decarboxylase gamma subunit
MDLFNTAIKITAIGMGGIFAFMFIFYLSIRLIDRLFPAKE